MSLYYRADGVNPACKKCSLSTGNSIHGQAEVPLNSVALIVVSAYPGNEELKQGITLAINNSNRMNAGFYIRKAISYVFDMKGSPIPKEYKPFNLYVFFTNAIRCSPLVGKIRHDIKDTHIKTCHQWLSHELSNMEGVPILACGSEAVKSLLGNNYSVYNNRGVTHNYNGHPLIITINPIEALRYHPMVVEEVTKKRNGTILPKKVVMGNPKLGSPPYFFKQDLIRVRSLVMDYLRESYASKSE